MKGRGDFSGHISFRVGDGSTVSFLAHKWCRENELREASPNLYSVSSQRGMTIQQIYKSHERIVYWDLRFRRDLQD